MKIQPPLSGGKLVAIAAYWNNASTDGVGVIAREGKKPGVLDLLAQQIEDGLTRYRQWNPDPGYLLDQLRTYATLPIVDGQRCVPPGHEIIVILNIAYLERIGLLQPDEYNGMQYAYEYS